MGVVPASDGRRLVAILDFEQHGVARLLAAI
jgi:hypothetical protein